MNLKTPASLAASALALSLSLSLSACDQGTGSTTESGVVAGRLFAPGGRPLAGARVSLLPVDHVPSLVLRKGAAAGEAITDADGRYRIAHVDSGIYALSGGLDSLAYFQDSVGVPASGLEAGADTARPAGTLAGRVRLAPGDEVRTVLILVLGTNTLTVPRDTSGAFALAGLAEGEYHVRFLSTLSGYRPLDTTLAIRSGRVDSLPSPIRLRSTGIPAVTGLAANWNADAQAVELAWDPVDSSLAAGYNVYRAKTGELMGTAPLNASPLRAPAFTDSAVQAGQGYVYAVKAVDRNGNVGPSFSPSAAVAAEAAYVQAGSVEPGIYNWDLSPYAVVAGEIYWVSADRVDVFDTSGLKVRTFGNTGPDSLMGGFCIRAFGDTLYVADTGLGADSLGMPAKKDGESLRIRRYSRQGAYLGSLGPLGVLVDPTMRQFDMQKGPDGSLYLTNGEKIFAFSLLGRIDSVASPLPVDVRLFGSRMERVPGGFAMIGSYCILNPGSSRCVAKSVTFGFDLRPGPVDSLPISVTAYAADGAGNLWTVQGDSLVEARAPDGKASRRIQVPKGTYRHLEVEDGVLYLFDTQANRIRIWRRK